MSVLLAGCSSDTVTPLLTTDVPVSFQSQTEAMSETRAGVTGEMDNTKLRNSHFGVFAYYTGGKTWAEFKASGEGYALPTTANFMYNQRVEYQLSQWTYEPLKYWPNDNQPADDNGATGSRPNTYLSFFAYSPYANLTQQADATQDATPNEDLGTEANKRTGIIGVSGNASTAVPSILYRLNTKSNEQVDLLWGTRGKATYMEADGTANTADLSTRPLNTDLAKQTTTERVDFLFRHALACIDVYVQRVYDELSPSGKTPTDGEKAKAASKIFVSGLELAIPQNGMYTQGRLDLSTGLWDGRAESGGLRNSEVFTIALDSTLITSDLIGTKNTEQNITTVRAIEFDRFDRKLGVNDTLKRLTITPYASMLIPTGGSTEPAGIPVVPTIHYNFVTQDDELLLNPTDTDGNHHYSRIQHSVTGSEVVIGTPYDAGGTTKYRLEGGKRYILVCYIGVESVQFVVTDVEDWDFPLRFDTGVEKWQDVDYQKDGTPKTTEEDTRWQDKTVSEGE